MIFGAIFRSLFPRRVKYHKFNYKGLSKIERVKHLEKRRQFKGYKKRWLYFRCKEENLLDVYNQLYCSAPKELDKRNILVDNRLCFSFGKYRDKPIEDIWNSDKSYIQWLAKQDWIFDYDDESDMIMDLVHPDRWDPSS